MLQKRADAFKVLGAASVHNCLALVFFQYESQASTHRERPDMPTYACAYFKTHIATFCRWLS